MQDEEPLNNPEKQTTKANNIDKLNPDNQSPPHSAPRKNIVKKWLIVASLVALLIIVGVIIWLLVRNTSNSNTLSKVKDNYPSSVSSKTSAGQTINIPNSINPINPTAIPLGTGKLGTTPQVGYVDFCAYNGNYAPNENLPWINQTNNTWNSTTKPSVQGSVGWANQAKYTVTVSGNTRTITTNDLPINHDTGVFPISTTDQAYQYDHNPNHIQAQATTWLLPANPTAAVNPGCTRDGPIGILTDGVFLFNALDAQNRDAGATEILDNWQGHPQSGGVYHHHTVPNFMLNAAKAKNSSTLIGYALDGYGIYIERDKNGNLLTNANLDECHGRTSEVMWNGKLTDIYHYDATLEYPYTIGCFHGTPITINHAGPGNNPSRPAPK